MVVPAELEELEPLPSEPDDELPLLELAGGVTAMLFT
jgi:hypothetical protein